MIAVRGKGGELEDLFFNVGLEYPKREDGRDGTHKGTPVST